MSRTSRLITGVILATVCGAVFFAAPVFAGGPSVSFSGAALPLVSCTSSPDRTSVTMTSDDVLHVQNITGHDAVIYVNDAKTAHVIGPNEGAPVTFPVGSWTVSLVPTCLLNSHNAGKVTVHVTAPAVVTPTPVHSASPPATPVATTRSTVVTARSRSSRTRPAANASPSPSTGRSSPDAASIGGVPSSSADGSGRQVIIGASVRLSASQAAPSPDYMLVLVALIGVIGIGSASIRALRHRQHRHV